MLKHKNEKILKINKITETQKRENINKSIFENEKKIKINKIIKIVKTQKQKNIKNHWNIKRGNINKSILKN